MMIYLSPTNVVYEGGEMNFHRDGQPNRCKTKGSFYEYSKSWITLKHSREFRTVNRNKTRCVIGDTMPPGWYDYHTLRVLHKRNEPWQEWVCLKIKRPENLW